MLQVVLPDVVREVLLGGLGGSPATSEATSGAGSVCTASPGNEQACDFSRVVLASTEDVWRGHFANGALPSYGAKAGAYVEPTLVGGKTRTHPEQ